jgi:hypothetical protein
VYAKARDENVIVTAAMVRSTGSCSENAGRGLVIDVVRHMGIGQQGDGFSPGGGARSRSENTGASHYKPPFTSASTAQSPRSIPSWLFTADTILTMPAVSCCYYDLIEVKWQAIMRQAG